MKLICKLVWSCTLFFFSAYTLTGQHLDVPRSSPKAMVSQHIGVCKVSVKYSKPSVKGRQVFGGLVPYDKIWRAGANEATIVEFTHAVFIGDQSIPAGKYGLFVLPTKDNWTVIFNRIWNQWGAYHYSSEEDMVRVSVRPQVSSHVEQLSYYFDGVTKSDGYLHLVWSDQKITIHISTETHKQTLEEIKEALNEASQNWYVYSAAAQYHFYEREEAEIALDYINTAIALKAPNPAPWMLKSQILASQHKYQEAIQVAQEAIAVSKKFDFYFEIEENEMKIKEWENK